MPNHPKRHHYLPESYLKRFTRDKALWVYDIHAEQIRAQTPKDTGAIGYFNALEDKDGNRSFGFEEALSKIEGEMSSVMIKIENREELSRLDRITVAHFVALQKLRGPDFHADISTMVDVIMRPVGERLFADREIGEKNWNNAAKETGVTSDVSFDEARDFILAGDYKIEAHRNWTLQLLLELTPGLTNLFLNFNWMILCAPPEMPFITSDIPFCIVPSADMMPAAVDGLGIATKGVWKMMPLSTTRCLIMSNPGNRYAYIDCDTVTVRGADLDICNGANRFVIGSDRELVESLVSEVQRDHSSRGTKWGGSRLVVR
jgi:hypothetical protein